MTKKNDETQALEDMDDDRTSAFGSGDRLPAGISFDAGAVGPKPRSAAQSDADAERLTIW